MKSIQILNIVRRLGEGDRILINQWGKPFTVCGVSDHYALAWDGGEEYTIIKRDPMQYGPYNGIPKGAIVCAPDWWTVGYEGGYRFDDPAWVRKYLRDLEAGKTEMSIRRREEIRTIRILPTNDREATER